MRVGGIALCAIAVLAGPAGCGEEKLTAEEFVAAMEAEGVAIELTEDELISDDPDKELRGFELEPLQLGGAGGHHAQGTLVVHNDNEGADQGMEECLAAGSLVCYRAANIVVILEEPGLEAQRLGVAVRKLGEE